MFGYSGEILYIDLTRGKISKKPMEEDIARKFIGAAGVQAMLLYRFVTPDIDPLSPENILMLGAGPLVGTFAPCSSRATFTARSPLTRIFGDSNVGGHFGLELKLAGYDHVIIRGRANDPVYLWIDDDYVEIKNAGHLWGRTTWDTDDMIKEEFGDPDIKTACIGPAGENKVKFSSIVVTRFRGSGKMGMGCVVGSKNLKAIAVRGSKSVKVAEPVEFEEIVNETYNRLITHPLYEHIATYGTLSHFPSQAGRKVLTTRTTSRLITDEWAEKLSLDKFESEFKTGYVACAACPIHCTHWHTVRQGPFAGRSGQKPDLVPITNFGVVCDVNDWASICAYHDFCNEYGIDVLEFGLLTGMLMSWYEKGIITKKTLGGIELTWGNINAVFELARKVIRREGFGDIAAEGVRGTCEKMGLPDYSPPGHVKGAAFSCGYDYRLSNTRALYYCTSPRGADHLKGHSVFEATSTPELAKEMFGTTKILDPISNEPAKGSVVKYHEDLYAVLHSAGLCLFGFFYFQVFDMPTMVKLLNAAIGWDLTEEELWKTGERIFNVMKAFNVRLGLTRKDDYPPKWYRETPVQWEVPAKGYLLNLDPLLDGYYTARGWDLESSWPTRQKLEELDLKEIADDLDGLGKLPRREKKKGKKPK